MKESPKIENHGDGTEASVNQDIVFGNAALLKGEKYAGTVLSRHELEVINQKVKETSTGIENDAYRLSYELIDIWKKFDELKKEAREKYGFNIEDSRELVLANPKSETAQEAQDMMSLKNEWESLKREQKKKQDLLNLKMEVIKYHN